MFSVRIARRLKSKITQNVSAAFGLRLVYTALTLAISLVLARVLGASGLGTYAYAIIWVNLISVMAMLGLDTFVMREIAVYRAESAWSLIRGLLDWADRVVLGVSMGLGLVASLVAWLLDGGAYSVPFIGFCLAMALVPIISLRNIRRGALQGLNQRTKGLLPELLIAPLMLLLAMGIVYWLMPQQFSVLWVLIFYGVGAGLTLMMTSRALNRSLPKPVRLALPNFDTQVWLSGALPFMLLESMPIINAQADILMLGAFQGVTAGGLYLPISRGAEVITLVLIAVSSHIAPAMVSAFQGDRLLDLQRMVTKNVRVIAGVAFLMAAVLIIGGNRYLALFGPAFVQGRRALYILCIGNFVSTSVSLSYVILNLTQYASYVATLGLVTTVLNISLNAIFIPLWGLEGAALATSTSLVCGAFVSLVVVRQKLGIDATLMGLPVKLPQKKLCHEKKL